MTDAVISVFTEDLGAFSMYLEPHIAALFLSKHIS